MTLSQLPGPSRGTPAYTKFFDPSLSRAGLTRPETPASGILFDAPGYSGGAASDLKVFAIANDMSACGNFRVRYPLMNLAAQGARVRVNLLSDKSPLHMEEMTWANVLLIQRWGTPEMAEALLMLSRSTGAAVVYEIDDYLHGVHPDSPAYSLYDKETPDGALQLRTLLYWMQEADGTIFSTRELASIYKPYTKYGHVIMNALDLEIGERDWNAPRPDWRVHAGNCHVTEKSLLFGVSFGDTHVPDMEVMGDAVHEIIFRKKDVFFGMQTSPQMAYEYTKAHDIPLDRVVYLPPTTFQNYPPSLSMFDVALCPLAHTTFNYCKSDLRILEFGAQGVPYVASKVAPFQRFHKETGGKGGVLASSPQQWLTETLSLLKSSSYRTSKGDFLRAHVRKNYDLHQSADDLIHSLRSFIVARRGPFRADSLQAVRDALHARPLQCAPVSLKDPCPCGSVRSYGHCCLPAWG